MRFSRVLIAAGWPCAELAAWQAFDPLINRLVLAGVLLQASDIFSPPPISDGCRFFRKSLIE
jgi:hypothetical protein